MDVYFDLPGIERTLGLFRKEQLRPISLADNWKGLLGNYDREVKHSLTQVWRRRGSRDLATLADMSREFVHARGEAIFRAERVGVFAYHIVESKGSLDYEVDIPKKPKIKFRGEFYLRETAANHIRPSLLELIWSRDIVIRPEFKQVFSVEQDGVDAPFDHVVICVTQVSLLPVPSFSNTLYLWQLPDGMTVPIGYAVYY